MNEESTFMDILNGNDSLKLSIGLSTSTIVYLALAVFVVGIALIAISKAWPFK